MTARSIDVEAYRKKLHKINAKAAEEVQAYLVAHDFEVDAEFIEFCHAITTKYGEAAGALACQMYDEIHAEWKAATGSKKRIKDAVPAEVPTIREIEKVVYGTLKTSTREIPGAVSRMVKRTAEDTTLKNSIRDGAEFAWIPHGETCAFCIALASRGWQRASKKALKNGHAEHIHSHCDCTYTIRFDHSTNVSGYDPDKYADWWDKSDGKNSKDKMRSLRQAVTTDKIGKYQIGE